MLEYVKSDDRRNTDDRRNSGAAFIGALKEADTLWSTKINKNLGNIVRERQLIHAEVKLTATFIRFYLPEENPIFDFGTWQYTQTEREIEFRGGKSALLRIFYFGLAFLVLKNHRL